MIKPLRGAQQDKAHPINRGLKCHLLVNEGDGKKVFDLSGNGNHGTINNMAFPPTAVSGWNAGRRGVGLKFDGTNDYVEATDSASLNFTKELTISYWVNWHVLDGSYDYLIDHGYTNRLIIYNPATYPGKIRHTLKVGGVGKTLYMDPALNTDEWYHCVLTYNGAKVQLYKNGVLNSDLDATGDLEAAGTNLFIGKYSGGAGFNPNVLIDQVRIYNRGLSAEEIKTLYLYPYVGFQQPCPAWLYATAAGGLSIPVAMHHYRGLRV